ncbi:ACP S-malonyltransferase [Paenibacillus sp. sgz500958]|uniref:ACP S-malonyltransferase n=1 Tax=Paenibacillus sp. sgz500958 TaxID=3242475 RepID=UPI0036D39DAB
MKGLAFVFPGQGSQYVGMGQKMASHYAAARRVFEEAGDVLGYDVMKLCFGGSMEELTRTEFTQPAILTASVAAFEVYMEEIGIRPAYAAGHSLGEFSALTTAGVISFSDALNLVRQRGQFMQEAAAEGMGAMCAVIGINRQAIEEVCRTVSTSPSRHAAISNYNSPQQTVISGHKAAVVEAGEKLKEMQARVTYLQVSAPFHSIMMEPAARKLEQQLRCIPYSPFKWPVISNVTGLPYSETDMVVHNLTSQMTAPVQWEASMKYLERQGVNTAVEMGPGKVLANLMKSNAGRIQCFPFDDTEQAAALGGHLQQQHPRHKAIIQCLAAAVCTRNRNWDQEAYRTGVIQPYQRLQEIQEQLDKEGTAPSSAQIGEAIELLKLIFETKQVPPEEQKIRLQEIMEPMKAGGGVIGLQFH